jgi:hypothetical protein
MKSNLKFKALVAAGMTRKLIIFLEIARHYPRGLTVYELSQKIKCGKSGVWHHTSPLIKSNLICLKKEDRESRKTFVFYVTPYGIDSVQREMEPICRMLAAVRGEMAHGK